jgi:methyl-accepting chemotaxis protein
MKQESSRSRGLRVWDKLAMVLVALAIPVAVLSYLVTLQGQEKIATATMQSHGIEYLRPLQRLMRELADHRDLNDLLLSGDREAAQKVREQSQRVDQALALVDQADAEYGKSFEADGGWAQIKAKWATLRSESARLSAAESLKRHNGLLRDIQSHHVNVAGQSKLLLDPDTQTYYLVDLWVDQVPQMIDMVAKVRNTASEGILSQVGAGAADAELQGRIAVLREQLGRVDGAVSLAVAATPSLRGRLETQMKAVRDSAERLIATASAARPAGQAASLKAMTDQVHADAGKAIAAGAAVLETVEPALREILDVRVAESRTYMMRFVGGGVTLALLAGFLGYVVMQTVTRPLAHLSAVARRVAAGDKQARARLETSDEIGELANQFDRMLDLLDSVLAEQVESARRVEKENEQLNSSVITLLQAVAMLSRRDLTVRVPVAEDVTGPVADAINLMTDETANVLTKVVAVAKSVARVSDDIKQQADAVSGMAVEEKHKVKQAAGELDDAARAMAEIAKLAVACNQAAEKAIQTTDTAEQTVLRTVDGINSIRDTIRETEKRIKRLGERSQEIGGVINLINSIAERTHILALNASMHAASAGEAGRGFAVVANEVQRLAENAREATSKISALVSNIQVETADTVGTMNEAISRVVTGTQLAEQAGAQMRDTRSTTAELVGLVQKIDASSRAQAQVALHLVERAGEIQKTSQATSDQLHDQAAQTEKLVRYSGALVESVGVFKLPETSASVSILPVAEPAGPETEQRVVKYA